MTAPMAFNGAMYGTTFLAYVDQALAPTLSLGDIVVMDNLRAHKAAAVCQAIEMFTPMECENYFAAAGYARE